VDEGKAESDKCLGYMAVSKAAAGVFFRVASKGWPFVSELRLGPSEMEFFKSNALGRKELFLFGSVKKAVGRELTVNELGFLVERLEVFSKIKN